MENSKVLSSKGMHPINFPELLKIRIEDRKLMDMKFSKKQVNCKASYYKMNINMSISLLHFKNKIKF